MPDEVLMLGSFFALALLLLVALPLWLLYLQADAAQRRNEKERRDDVNGSR